MEAYSKANLVRNFWFTQYVKLRRRSTILPQVQVPGVACNSSVLLLQERHHKNTSFIFLLPFPHSSRVIIHNPQGFQLIPKLSQGALAKR